MLGVRLAWDEKSQDPGKGYEDRRYLCISSILHFDGGRWRRAFLEITVPPPYLSSCTTGQVCSLNYARDPFLLSHSIVT